VSAGVGSGGKFLDGLSFDTLASLESATLLLGLSTTVERLGIRAVSGSFRSRRTLTIRVTSRKPRDGSVSPEEREVVSAEVVDERLMGDAVLGETQHVLVGIGVMTFCFLRRRCSLLKATFSKNAYCSRRDTA